MVEKSPDIIEFKKKKSKIILTATSPYLRGYPFNSIMIYDKDENEVNTITVNPVLEIQKQEFSVGVYKVKASLNHREVEYFHKVVVDPDKENILKLSAIEIIGLDVLDTCIIYHHPSGKKAGIIRSSPLTDDADLVFPRHYQIECYGDKSQPFEVE